VNRLAIDLSAVGHMSSAAYGLLVYALDVTARAGGALVIASVPPTIMEVMRVLGLHQVFAFAATVEEAERILQSTSGSA
jgi:anti-anti-sigma factor